MAEAQYIETSLAYPTANAMLDRRHSPPSVPIGSWVRLRGVDGRYDGGLRRFPGFNRVLNISDVSIDTVTQGTVLSSVWFLKHVAVQTAVGINRTNNQPLSDEVGIGSHRALRGFVVAHDYDDCGETMGILRFVYWDPLMSAWRSTTLLRERAKPSGTCAKWYSGNPVVDLSGDAPTLNNILTSGVHTIYLQGATGGNGGDPKIFTIVGYDPDAYTVTLGKHPTNSQPNGADWYITLCVNRRTDIASSTFPTYGHVIDESSWIDAAAMSNFIYFCVNRGNPKGENGIWGFEARDHYRRSVRVQSTGGLATSLQWHYTNIGPPGTPRIDVSDTIPTSIVTMNSAVGQIGVIQGKIALAVRLYSALKNVYGPFINRCSNPNDPESGKVYMRARDDDDAALPDIRKLGDDDYELFARIRTYRSIDSYWFETEGVDVPGLIGGTLFGEKDINIDYNVALPPSGSTDDGASYADSGTRGYNLIIGTKGDTALVARNDRIAPMEDDMAEAPKSIYLLCPYQGTLLRVGSIPRAVSPAVTIDRSNMLSWGSLLRYAPEECRVQDATPLGSGQDEFIWALVTAKDFAFAIGDSGVFRIHRNGQLLAINELQSLAGGVGRWSNVSIGSTLFYLSPHALYAIDAASGDEQIVSAVGRIVLDEWRDTLPYVRMAADAALGAVIMSNTATKTAYLLWLNTGIITELVDFPFGPCTSGIDPTTGGSVRSFWVLGTGAIFTPNTEREQGVALSMCGGAVIEGTTWNGQVESGTSSWMNIEGTLDPKSIGFEVYFLSGDNAGQHRTIASIGVEPDVTWTTPLPQPVAPGDRFSIAPVIFEVVGWPLQASDGIDLWRRKIVVATGCSLVLLGGETGDANPNLLVEHSIYHRDDLAAPCVSNLEGSMSEEAAKNFVDIRYAGPSLMPGWAQRASNLDFELLGGIVKASIPPTDAESPAL